MRTREEVEKAAQSFQRDERWLKWTVCGQHPVDSLPVTESGERYCENCCTLWTAAGEMLNQPVPICHGCGKPFSSGDKRTSSWTNTADGQAVAEPSWHQDCWDAHVAATRP
jgi:hypothetical protein